MLQGKVQKLKSKRLKYNRTKKKRAKAKPTGKIPSARTVRRMIFNAGRPFLLFLVVVWSLCLPYLGWLVVF